MKLITATIAGIATVAAMMTPAVARADSEDLARILAGAVAVGIIAKTIENRREKREAVEATHVGRLGSHYDDYGYRGDYRFDDDYRYRDKWRPGGPKRQRGYKRTPLPEACLFGANTLRGERLVYGARCLDRRFRHASKLPEHCETAVKTRRGWRGVFGARCLARDGWMVARR